jgi:hypothetical protein
MLKQHNTDHKEPAVLYTLEIYKRDRRVKTGERLVGRYDYERQDPESILREIQTLHPLYGAADGYRFDIVETMVTRTNAITGQSFQERYDTCFYTSPSSETYWSS